MKNKKNFVWLFVFIFEGYENLLIIICNLGYLEGVLLDLGLI